MFPSRSLTPPRDDHDRVLEWYPSYWLEVVLNLITPSLVIAGPGLDAVSPAGTAKPDNASTPAILPCSGLRVISLAL